MIDRDGVINEDSSAFIKSVAEWRPIAGSLEGRRARRRLLLPASSGCRLRMP
jgi:histidinol phosphatase-like enzyme